jgi:4-carboxymuconolactone decarboxylase
LAAGVVPGTGRQPVLVGVVDELVRDDRLSEPTWEVLNGQYAPDEILEIIAMVGFYRMLAGILNTVGVEVEDDLCDSG